MPSMPSMQNQLKLLVSFICLAGLMATASAADLPKLPTDAAEPQVIEFLGKAGRGADAYAAQIATKAWLSRNSSPSAALLLAAADTAAAAGDLQTAAALYKRHIAAAPADEARSKVAAKLYEILIGHLQSNDDIYSFFTRGGFDLRQSLEARQFDRWFLGQARARNDSVTAAKILAAVMAEKPPLELERNLYWDHLDWLMGELARARPEQFEAVPAAKQIVGLVRESPPRAARYGFITAWLEFQAAIAGKDAAAQAAAFAPVAAAATAYADAVPTAAVLYDVLNVFVCGTGGFQPWQSLGGPITSLWAASFAKLPDDEKAKAINWNGWWNYQASAEQWVELGARFPQVFRTAVAARGLPFLLNKPDPAIFAKQATFLAEVPSDAARIVNSVNATKGTDLLAGLKHLSQAETWYGTDFAALWPAAGQVVGIWRTFPREPVATEPDVQKAVAAWGREAIARTPAALSPAAAAGWLAAAFAAADIGDKAAFAADLRRLDWVPWDANGRTMAIKPSHDASKQWADQVRNQFTAAQAAAKAAADDQAKAGEAAKWEKIAAQIAPLEEEFKKAFDVNVPATADAAKLADPLAMHLARCEQAIREKKLDAYVASAREAYKIVRLYPAQKTPFGQAAFTWLLTNRPDAFDIVDFQAEVIADQIAVWEAGKPTAAIVAIDTALGSGRPNGAWNNVPADRSGHALKLSAVIVKGILDQLAKNRYEPDLFARFRHTKMGPGWCDQEAGKDVLAKLIETKAFLVYKQPNATASYQYLVRSEFQGLAKQYPAETFFDDLFVEESKANGWLDWTFFNYNQDQKLKAAGLAAEFFAGRPSLASGPNAPMDYDRLPQMLVAGDRRDVPTRPVTWGPTEVRNWYERALLAPAAQRAKFVETAEAGWGTARFDAIAMGNASLPVDPAAIAAPQARGEYFKRLAAVLARRKTQPAQTPIPPLGGLAQIQAPSYAPEELATLLAVFDLPSPPGWPGGQGYEAAGFPQGAAGFPRALAAADRDADLLRIAPALWRIGREAGGPTFITQTAAFATTLAKAGKPGVAAAIAESGLQMLGQTLPEAARGQLAAIRTDALLALGGGNPVPRNDPRWPIYEAQIQFAAGKPQSAWELYLPAATVVSQIYKELDPTFTAWLIRENTETGNFDRAREVGQLLLAWSEANPGALTPEGSSGLLLAYADIALARREYAQARALYERIAAAKEFDGTTGKRDAELRIAEVDRLTRQFDKARDLLQRLTRRPDRGAQAQAYYQLALLKTDQEEIEEAAAFLEEVFTRIPNHVGGRILEGKINLLRRKYDVASKVKLGVLGDKKFLIPGKPLEVDLEDRNLAVVGKAAQIEIRVWTASGDEEQFNLFSFGDSKTRFTGQIPTQLGAPAKGDHVLQLVGGDTVRYTFAESFTAGKAAIEEPAAMTVVSDGELFVSSGRILSREEQENRALEKLIRARLALDSGGPQEAALSALRSDDQIKPGNPVNVRVVDPDRSTTANRDTIEVRTTTASGDSLGVKLVETEPFSGVFEGAVPTGSGQATAYASDSTDGTDPNNAIGPASDTPWVGLADNKRPKLFAVDLNDNVALGKMTVTAAVPGRKLKDVLVQTSLNGRDFRTVGQWRADGKASFVPWNGGPRLELVRIVAQPAPLDTVAKFEDYLQRGRFATGSPLVTSKIETLAVGPWGHDLGGQAGPMALNTNYYVGHWVAGFEVAKPQTRTFTIDPKGKTENIRYLLAIDGKVSEVRDAPLKITRALTKGVHRIDVYAYAYQHNGLNFEVLIDSPEAPFTASIPQAFFSIEKHPAIAEAFGTAPATITANIDGSVLTVAFAAEARSRVVRLILADYETDAPAINSVALVDAAGKKVLPTDRGFRDLAKNDVLEIIPGDKITVLYEDPTVISPERQSQEKFLTATFTNAEVSAAFVEFLEHNGVRRTRYVPMRRFAPGDTVKVFIGDPDMDISPEPDRVSFTVRAGRGKPVKVEALETDVHSGVFIGTVFPVAGEPTRDTELKVATGDDLFMTYVDRDNTDPGIPWERTSLVEQSGADEPELRVYDVASRPLDDKEQAAIAQNQAVGRRFEEWVAVTREIVAVRPETAGVGIKPASILVDGPLLVEVLAPAAAKSAESETVIYVQTAAGRQKLGREVSDEEFPLDAPGTIRLERRPGDVGGVLPPPGTSSVVVRGNRFAVDALAEGRFTFLVQKQLGPVPDTSLAEVEDITGGREPPVLQIQGNDTIYVGHRFTTAAGEERWAIQPIMLTSDVLFDVMDERYRKEVEGTFVGDSLHVRLINQVLDVSNDKDEATVRIVASGGGELDLVLTETFGHSGVFKGAARLAYTDAAAPVADGRTLPVPDGRTLPVVYGETVSITYQPPTGDAIQRQVAIFKGGDASVVPFTKRFKDPTIAVQTQFTVAEAWFELAKRHRELGQESLARREIAQGKKLLEEAIRDYPDTDARAQADYLLANLSYEFSKEAANAQIARQHSLDAVARFSDIVSSHPDSEYAPKSQYKKAIVLETLGEIDQACEEYVKLSYRYPDNELVAETIARLGQYFLGKGKKLDEESAAQQDPVQRERVAIQGREMFTTAAEVFGRLSERFPQHALANKTKMLSAQCYLRAKDYERSLAVFEGIAKDPQSDKDLAAEAMYWAGDICLQTNKMKDAYQAFKKVTWDYPESKWAKFARGRLTEDAMVGAADAEEKQ
ncbi:MAG: tetratricopeptide repeat protein [Planctomycetota bacterium]